jgi:membrane-associated phospholipid phosphatase
MVEYNERMDFYKMVVKYSVIFFVLILLGPVMHELLYERSK